MSAASMVVTTPASSFITNRRSSTRIVPFSVSSMIAGAIFPLNLLPGNPMMYTSTGPTAMISPWSGVSAPAEGAVKDPLGREQAVSRCAAPVYVGDTGSAARAGTRARMRRRPSPRDQITNGLGLAGHEVECVACLLCAGSAAYVPSRMTPRATRIRFPPETPPTRDHVRRYISVVHGATRSPSDGHSADPTPRHD